VIPECVTQAALLVFSQGCVEPDAATVVDTHVENSEEQRTGVFWRCLDFSQGMVTDRIEQKSDRTA
jgi:hypothetical protein